MEFRHLEYFRAVVEAGSVSQAARNLNMTQPPVSLAISQLERELGVQLLERTSKGVRPTQAGTFLFADGGRLVAERDRIAGTLAQMGEGAIGTLRVGVDPLTMHEIVADIMSEFLRRCPGVRVTLTDVTPDLVMEGVRAGEMDLGCVPFAAHQFAEDVAANLEWRASIPLAIKLAVPAERAGEHHPDGVGWGRWILPYRVPGLVGIAEAAQAALSGHSPVEFVRVSTPQTALALVAAGVGVAPVTERLAASVSSVAVVAAPAWLRPLQATHIWRRGSELTPAMSRWLEAAEKVARERDRSRAGHNINE